MDDDAQRNDITFACARRWDRENHNLYEEGDWLKY